MLYQPLEPSKHEIRLLEVEPGQFNSDLICSLRHVSLLDAPDYETVSYVWGDAALRGTIILNEELVSVPANSAAALRRLRMDTASRVLFVDAVCIDQDNSAERAHQVGLMREVYSKGCNNLIYLGESETAEEEVAEMYKLHNEARTKTRDFTDWESTVFGPTRHFVISRTSSDADIDWTCLERLWSNPWFGRVWVIQEAALAANNLCTYSQVSFPLLDLLRADLWRRHGFAHLPVFDTTLSTVARISHELYQLTDRGTSDMGITKKRAAVAQALDISRQLLALDPRDKVYGILGLMTCTSQGTKLPEELQPNYQKDVQLVYRDAARLALTENDGQWADYIFQRMYSRSQSEVERLTAPSWVPSMKQKGPAGFNLPKFFRASDGLLQPQGMHLTVGDGLVVRHGMSLDKTAMVFDKSVNSVEDGRALDGDTFQAWLTELYALSKDHLPERVAATLLAGRNSYSAPVTPVDLAVWTVHREHMLRQTQLPSILAQSEGLHVNLETSIDAFVSSVVWACTNRRIFKTETGQLGLGPKAMRPGDIVVILYGCQRPYVLRPFGEHYKILGDCYIDGVMYGEAVKTHKAEGKADEVFTLC